MKSLKQRILDILIGTSVFIISLVILFAQLTISIYIINLVVYFNKLYPIIGLIISTLLIGSIIKYFFRTIKYNRTAKIFMRLIDDISENKFLVNNGYKNKDVVIQICEMSIVTNTKDLLVRSIIPITITAYFIAVYAGRV